MKSRAIGWSSWVSLFVVSTVLFPTLLPTTAKAQVPKQNADADDGMVNAADVLAKLEEMSKKLDTFATREELMEHAEKVAQLRSDLDELTGIVHEQYAEQRKILESISRPDGSGNPILALRSIMRQSPEFRDEVAGAVHETMEQAGRVVIENRMSTAQAILVNGVQQVVQPGATTTVNVPVGTVTTELAGYEQARNWTLAPPNYEQRIEIKPREVVQQQVARPVISYQPTYWSWPAYYSYYSY